MKSVRIRYKILIALLAIVAVTLMVILGKAMIYEPVTNDATEKLMTEVATQYLSDEEALRANQAISRMTDDDKDKIKEILSRNIDNDDILPLVEATRSGDTEKLRNYIHSNLSESDIQEILAIYRKYD